MGDGEGRSFRGSGIPRLPGVLLAMLPVVMLAEAALHPLEYMRMQGDCDLPDGAAATSSTALALPKLLCEYHDFSVPVAAATSPAVGFLAVAIGLALVVAAVWVGAELPGWLGRLASGLLVGAGFLTLAIAVYPFPVAAGLALVAGAIALASRLPGGFGVLVVMLVASGGVGALLAGVLLEADWALEVRTLAATWVLLVLPAAVIIFGLALWRGSPLLTGLLVIAGLASLAWVASDLALTGRVVDTVGKDRIGAPLERIALWPCYLALGITPWLVRPRQATGPPPRQPETSLPV